MIRLENYMANYFPQQVSTLIMLAEAMFKSEDFCHGKVILDQVHQINSPRFNIIAEKIQEKYPDAISDNPTFSDKYNINSISVIESDDSEWNRVQSCLISFGIPNIRRFKNYEDAWKAFVEKFEDDIVIFEWSTRQQGLTCEQFVKRFRAQISRSIPLIIMVSTIPDKDYQMISDMRIIEVVKRPIREENFLMMLNYTIEQLRHPTEPKILEWKIRQLLSIGDSPYIQHLKSVFIKDRNIDPKRKFYLKVTTSTAVPTIKKQNPC